VLSPLSIDEDTPFLIKRDLR